MKTNGARLHLTVLTLAGVIVFTGCSKNSDCKEPTTAECKEQVDKTNIRIRNNTQYAICNVTITPSGSSANYGLLEKTKQAVTTILKLPTAMLIPFSKLTGSNIRFNLSIM